MRSIEKEAKIFLWLGAIDMRMGFDRLASFTKDQIKREIISGGYFVFVSRKRDRVKILYWDADGYAMWQKRLESGVFRIEHRGEHEEISAVDLEELLRGVELRRITFRKNIGKRIAESVMV